MIMMMIIIIIIIIIIQNLVTVYTSLGSHDSLFSITLRPPADSHISQRANDCGAHLTPFSGIKREVGYSLAASSGVNKTCSCNSSLPKKILQSVTLIRYKGNFCLLILKPLLFSQNLFLAADATVISLP